MRELFQRRGDDEMLLNIALGQLEMTAFHWRRGNMNTPVFEAPRRVQLWAAAQHAHLVVVVIKSHAAFQIFFKPHILDEAVTWQLGPGAAIMEIGNNSVYRLAHDCEKL